MASLHLVSAISVRPGFDAVLPQTRGLGAKPCQFGPLSVIVHMGRTQAAHTSQRGSAFCETLQENRSRGCRAPRSFCRCAWLPLWQPALAPKKMSFMLMSRPSRSSRPTPTNTNDNHGRAAGAPLARPALFLPVAVADGAQSAVEQFASLPRCSYAARTVTLSHWRFTCGAPLSLPCWPWPPSPPAPNRRPSPSRFRSRLSPRRPANTVPDFPERARRGNRPAPVPAPRCAPEHEVRPC